MLSKKQEFTEPESLVNHFFQSWFQILHYYTTLPEKLKMTWPKKMTPTAVYRRAQSRNLCIRSRLPMKVVFHQRSSSIECWLPLNVVFNQRMSYIKGCLPSEAVFHRSSSSIVGHLPSKVVFYWRSSSIIGRLPSKIVCNQRLSTIKGRLPSKGVFHQSWTINCRPKRWKAEYISLSTELVVWISILVARCVCLLPTIHSWVN